MSCSENQEASQEPCILKRKRTSKTSEEQLLEYIKLMEEDIIFRTKTITPGTEPDEYVNKKWEKLARKLNALDTGPQLSVANWKTRFTNYKNTTRAKYRKKMEDMKRTGGGPPTEILLSPLEERLLDICGRVAVTGSKKVTVTGGLQSYLKENEPEMVQDINSENDPCVLENISTKDIHTEINTKNNTEEFIVLEYVNDSPFSSLENTEQIDISESPRSRNLLNKPRKALTSRIPRLKDN
ncbi:uncharacterized protein LOC108906202 [Anoplophora glabripennis]|uniref:uncharacterized protein LOC108906202 n=1 Tax=Anoplophora glabripennis TaxID=217634 RepID=UPI00087383EB|nr:uncharacterized protein LOC108906202 [Anoplophora glabripennis]